MNDIDELQINPLANQLIHAIENRSIEIVEVQNILIHQHHSPIDLSMIPILLLACELLNYIPQYFVLLLGVVLTKSMGFVSPASTPRMGSSESISALTT
ncbi:hypothetical protein FF1_000573 [Malus domestica]